MSGPLDALDGFYRAFIILFCRAFSFFINVSRHEKDSDMVGHGNVHSSSCRTVKLAVVQKWYHKLFSIVKPPVKQLKPLQTTKGSSWSVFVDGVMVTEDNNVVENDK